MIYRNATIEDIPALDELQKKYHITTIDEADKADGFVTTLFTDEQFKELIEKENGITVACDGARIIAYVMAASWEYWSRWPLFQHMINDLHNTEYMGQILTTENSYQYGPVCIHKDYRGSEVLIEVFDFSRVQMKERYPILITFINHINTRSYYAHTKKLGLDEIKSFEFNQNTYYELGYDTSKAVERKPK
ncbi:MAG: GNAT family acetyltransferase [Firmicutes bacterium HGW-Firmicutes-16]|nr:MAG: GNAT family acetyltransferase [Firmicutes bacterium HGW-Firmicutes-16]